MLFPGGVLFDREVNNYPTPQVNSVLKLTVDQIAEYLNVTRRTFERRFKKATHNTVAEYIQRVKIEASKKYFEIGKKSIYDVMLDVGYSDTQTFRAVFKTITGITPNEYRKKYNKDWPSDNLR